MANGQQQIDYAALAKQAGAISSQPAQSGNVDYAALAKQAGAVDYQPPETSGQALSKTLANQAAAMSGQPQTTPGGQQQFDQGRQAGMTSAALTAATGTLGGALGASSVVKAAGPLVPAGRDALGRMLPWVSSQIEAQGPSLAKQGISAGVSLAKAHPLIAWGAGMAAARLATKLGIPLRKVLDLVVGPAGVPE